MSILKYVKIHEDDILAFTKDQFKDPQEKHEVVLAKLLQAGLRVNVEKSFFSMDAI